MSLINIVNLTFAYDGSYDNVFENVSFQMDTAWRLGFTGRNGRGKTTFMNLLTGKYEYSGSISASVGFEYFPYPVADKSLDTIDVLYGVHAELEHWMLLREFSLLDLEEDVLYRPFNTLSNGEQTKALLAVLFLKENSFLLIDEPTNHLDMRAREIVSDYLKAKSGFILVSHDRVFLDNCIDHILSINRADIEIQRGNFSSWLVNKERQDGFEQAENEKLKKDIKRLDTAARRTSGWSDKVEATKCGTKNSGLRPDRGYIGHKSAKMMARSKAIETRRQSAIDEKSELLKNLEKADDLKISPLAYHTRRLAEIKDLSLFYGDKRVCENVTSTIEQGDKIALCGRNGSGKSSIIKRILGEDIACEGGFQIGSRLVISYVPQDTSFLHGGLTDYAMACGIDESLFKAILRKLDFARVQFEKDMEAFSAGQRKKVLIARSLCERAHLYVWDEPLNYVDVLSRMQIEELLRSFDITLLFVEHDRAFCDRIATKKIVLQ